MKGEVGYTCVACAIGACGIGDYGAEGSMDFRRKNGCVCVVR